MPTIMREGELGLPVTYETWDHWRRDQATPEPGPATLPPAAFCAVCWGQGRILSGAANGEGLVPGACATCGGTGRAPAGP